MPTQAPTIETNLATKRAINLNVLIVVALLGFMSWLFQDAIRARIAGNGGGDRPQPAPVVQLGIASAMQGPTADVDAAYIAELFGRMADMVETSDKIKTTSQLMESVVHGVGNFGAIGKGWKINDRYPGIPPVLRTAFQSFATPGPLTDARRSEFVSICRQIEAEARAKS